MRFYQFMKKVTQPHTNRPYDKPNGEGMSGGGGDGDSPTRGGGGGGAKPKGDAFAPKPQ